VKLGRALSLVERRPGTTSLTGLTRLLAELGLSKPTAMIAQRIGAMPQSELRKAFAWALELERLLHIADLVTWARPWWYKANREARHRAIHAAAGDQAIAGVGPFPLIYADPPWKFEIYSEKGLERTPDQHYPTLSAEAIMTFCVGGLPMQAIAHRDAALLLWCTSSNLPLGLDVLAAWGFVFKASSVWVKDKSGLGLVFRNQHEVLLYGTRGNMPGPQYQPPSVFSYPRGAHSAKPPEIRTEIEKMFPDFDAATRLELFAREQNPGWTCHGYESHPQ
jgi:N6-adenosine-specific RNA methylase IME4